MVAKLAMQSVGNKEFQSEVMNEIRAGAARQHLDAVLVYEAYSKTDTKNNLLAIANLTIIGGYILPSQSTETEGYATAMLIDVMQGYPYGTMNVTIDKEEAVSSRWGWGSEDRKESTDRAKTKAVIKLTSEVETTIRKLRTELETKNKNQ